MTEPATVPDTVGPVLQIPALSLVLLIGASGSGKSTFARAHFLPTEVVSSDTCRGLVSDDETDQSATRDAFAVLEFIVATRLRAGRLTVVDATNVQPSARAGLVALARAHDVLPVAIVLDLSEKVCLERNGARTDRSLRPDVVKRQRAQLHRGMSRLDREGIRHVDVLRTVEEIATARVERRRLYTDLRHETGPFDVIGDVHGCRVELEDLLIELGYRIARDDEGRAVGARHEAGRRAVFLGDLVDRGPDTPGVLRLAMGMVDDGDALCVPGNHEDKLLRALRGRPVQRTHGLAESLQQLESESPEFRDRLVRFLDGLVSHYVLDGGALVVCHAGLVEDYHNRASRRVRQFCLYGETTGETDEFGLPVRYPWAQDYRGDATVLYGHTPTPDAVWTNRTMCLDTGAVFGGRLTAMRWPEKELVAVTASAVHYEPARPFPVASETDTMPDASGRRDLELLDLRDVTGKRSIETAWHGRVSIPADGAAAALEVMARFAADPRVLAYLPPTMSPVATSHREGVLEHPDEAFASYARDGLTEVVCQEKHMGSRAVVLLCRDAEVARARFGITDALGAVWTRTGRPFFDTDLAPVFLDRLQSAAHAAGVFAPDGVVAVVPPVSGVGIGDDPVDPGRGPAWVLLDAEIVPWNAKASGLVREQYAATGAAARQVMPEAVRVLELAAARGLDGVGPLLERTRSRRANAGGFVDAYRRHLSPVTGLGGIEVAVFSVLAADGRRCWEADQAWHLRIADALVAADPVVARATDRRFVTLADPDSMAAAVSWWEDLTARGGEGMVVKPSGGPARGAHGLVQPGLKVRGREYLRLVYGPDYTEPMNLERLRQRGVGRKRSLALREYALGLEGLTRLVDGEPLYRVHECAAAVLALEAEPVDPRL